MNMLNIYSKIICQKLNKKQDKVKLDWNKALNIWASYDIINHKLIYVINFYIHVIKTS